MVFMHSSNDEFLVLDGQQRLATAVMLLSAIRRWMQEHDRVREAVRLNESFIGREKWGDDIVSPRLVMNAANNHYFHEVVINDVALPDLRAIDGALTKYDRNKFMIAAAICCHERVAQLHVHYNDVEATYRHLIEIIAAWSSRRSSLSRITFSGERHRIPPRDCVIWRIDGLR
jgi:hypothetical protein